MSRPLRDTDPDKVHLITCRVAASELLLVPSSKVNEIIGGILGRYTERHGIDLYAYVVLSNHYHLVVRAEEGVLPIFAADLNREITKRINRFIGRGGRVWARRYDDQVTIEEYDALEALIYVATNPVRHGLVSHPRHWPGLSCYSQLLGSPAKTFSFMHYTQYFKAKKQAEARGESVRKSDYCSLHQLNIKPLPMIASLSKGEQLELLNKRIEERVSEIRNERRRAGVGFLGRKAVLNQQRERNFPKSISSSKRPRCFTKNLSAIREFAKEEKLKREAYATASILFRLGKRLTEFPPFCLLPPLHYVPKVNQFAPS